MAIKKNPDIHNALLHLNWDIFTWKVYVGDAIEDAIDWVIDGINWAIAQGELAWNKAVAAWDKAIETGKELGVSIASEAQKLWNKIETWGDDLREWWEAKKTNVKGWIDIARDFLSQRIDDARRFVNKLDIEWHNFRSITLPTLASHLDVGKAFNDFRLEWSTLFNFWGEFCKDVVTFFTDPLEWLLAKFTDWFLGPEE